MAEIEMAHHSLATFSQRRRGAGLVGHRGLSRDQGLVDDSKTIGSKLAIYRSNKPALLGTSERHDTPLER